MPDSLIKPTVRGQCSSPHFPSADRNKDAHAKTTCKTENLSLWRRRAPTFILTEKSRDVFTVAGFTLLI